MSIPISDTPPENIVIGTQWAKRTKKGKFLVYNYDGKEWLLSWKTEIRDMIFTLSIFGKVDFKFQDNGDWWITFCPDNSHTWIYKTGKDLRETLVQLVTKALELKLLQ